jgi:tetratricopeptide (TPR) repeat protein
VSRRSSRARTRPRTVRRPRLRQSFPLFAAVALVIVAGAIAYSNGFRGVFVFDDEPAIVENEYIRRLWPLSRAMGAPPGTTVSGRPVVALSLAVNYALAPADARDVLREPPAGASAEQVERFHRNLRGYHAVNLLVHLAAALTLFGIVRRTLLSEPLRARFGPSSTTLALVVSLLWVVHPLTTASVTYVIQRAESLMALCYLLTVYCAIRAMDAGGARGGRLGWGAASVAACALGMATKESMVTAPLAVMLWDFQFVRSPDGAEQASPRASSAFRPVLAQRWPLYASLAATWIVLALLVAGDHRPYAAGFHFAEWPWWRYLATQAGVLLHYLRLVFLPWPLVLDYDWPAVGSVRSAFGPIAVMSALATATVAAVARRQPVGFPAGVFFLVLGPTSSVLPIVSEVAAEHRMYLPLAAAVAIVVPVAATALKRAGISHRIGVLTVILLAAGLCTMTLARNRDYQTFERIWLDTVQKRPANARARTNYATALLQQGRYAEAEEQSRAAVAVRPRMTEAHLALGVGLLAQRRFDEGITHLHAALETAPGNLAAHRNLAEAFASQGRMVEAVRHYDEALRRAPDDVMLLNRVGWILATAGAVPPRDGHRAVALAERAVQLTSAGDVESLDTLAAAYAEAGRFDDAVAAGRRALDLARTRRRVDMVPELGHRLALYERRQAVRQ